MQEDKILFSEKVPAGKRTYFLDVKETRDGSHLLKITESRKHNGEFIRTSVSVFQEDFDKILGAFQNVKDYIRENPSPKPNRVFPERNYNAVEKVEDFSF